MRPYIKDINFLPQRIIKSRQRRRNLFVYGLACLILFGLMGVAVWLPYSIADSYQQQLAKVQAEVKMLDPAESYYKKLSTLQEQLETNNKAVEHIESKQQPITEILQQINDILPSNCFVSYLALKAQGEFTLEVVTNNPVETAKVLVGLRNLGIFEKVDLADAGGGELDKGEVPFIHPENKPQEVTFNLILAGHSSDRTDVENESDKKDEG